MLNRGYLTLQGAVIRDDLSTVIDTTVEFFGDGRLLQTVRIPMQQRNTIPFTANVEGVRRLEIRVTAVQSLVTVRPTVVLGAAHLTPDPTATPGSMFWAQWGGWIIGAGVIMALTVISIIALVLVANWLLSLI